MEMPVKQAVPFAFTNPYAWPRKPLLSANVVSTSQPLATAAGLQILAKGGNAADAAVAAGAALSQTPRARMVPLDHLLTVELLSLGVWIGLTVPGLLLIRSMLRSRSVAARSLLSGLCVALGLGIFYSDFLRTMP